MILEQVVDVLGFICALTYLNKILTWNYYKKSQATLYLCLIFNHIYKDSLNNGLGKPFEKKSLPPPSDFRRNSKNLGSF